MQSMIHQMADKLVDNRDDQFCNFNSNISEMFLFTNPVSVVKAVYDHLSESNMLSDTDLELAIMTSIAIGGDHGAELEREFPHLKGANPNHVGETYSRIFSTPAADIDLKAIHGATPRK